ncbi:MAG TPA: restriction endonuclease subunit S, partial [Abditibacteriaceae bacterium]
MSNLSMLDGWRTVSLREVAEKIVDGSHNPPAKQETGIPMLSARNIAVGAIEYSGFRYISPEAFETENKRTDLRAGDVLLTIVGTIGRAAVIPESAEPFALQRSVAMIRARELDSKFLMYQLLSETVQKWLRAHARGSAQQGVYLKTLGTLPILIAPLDEQRGIVAEIEKQFTRLDAGVTALRKVQSKLKRYRASVLKAACEGRLVPTEAELARNEGRDYESADKLLARILDERRAKWNGRGKYAEPAPPSTAELSQLPEGWAWTSLEQLFSLLRNGISTKPDAEDGLSILRISAVRPLSVNISDVRYLNVVENDYSEYLLVEGDLLFTRYNGNPDLVGVCGTVPALDSPLVHPDKLIRCKLVTELLVPKYVAMMANVGESRAYLAKRVRTTAGQAGISGSDLKGLPIPLPPLTEQERIVAEVERRLSVVDELEATVTANLQRAARLRQAVLQKAFTGQLVAAETSELHLVHAEPKKAQLPNRHFLRAVLSGEIVHQLHREPTFGRVKHQKILHLCEFIAELEEIEGEYKRKAAGPMDNKLIFGNESEIKKQQWYTEVEDGTRHFYEPLEKAGGHRKYLEKYWPDKVARIEELISVMRTWNTEKCE